MADQKLIDAAVRTRFRLMQLKLLLQPHQATRHVELDGVAGEALQAQRGIVLGCAFATSLLQLLLVGPLREVRATHRLCPSVSWSMTFHCSVSATTTAFRKDSSLRARAWRPSSCKQGAR